MKVKMLKLASGPEGQFLKDKTYELDAKTAKAFEKDGAAEIIKQPVIETATAPPAAETAVVNPQVQDNKNEQANLQLSAKDIDKLKDNELKALAGKNNIDISKCKNIKEVQKAVKTALNLK